MSQTKEKQILSVGGLDSNLEKGQLVPSVIDPSLPKVREFSCLVYKS